MKDPDSAKRSASHTTLTLGERAPLNSPIYLAPYDPAWRSMFLLQANRIRDALSKKVLLLEHVGSTSVPGLSAKPIIDMVLAVSDSADERSYLALLEEQGFVLRFREPDWFEHRLLKTPDIAGIFTSSPSDAKKSTECWHWHSATGSGYMTMTDGYMKRKSVN